MPRGARAGLESDGGADNARRFGRLKEQIDPNRAREILRWPLSRGLRTVSVISICLFLLNQ
jgi:hypothetical protein